MKNRYISVLFILCLVVALTLSASAESTNKLTYAVGASAPTVSANGEFTITVDITENTGFCWLKVIAEYDSSVLTYVEASTDTSAFKSSTVTVNNNANKGQSVIVVGTMSVLFEQNPAIITNKGTVAILKFKVKPNVPDGTKTTVKVSTNDVIKIVGGVGDNNYDSNEVSFDITVSSSDHTACTPGAPVKEKIVEATCTAKGSYEEVVYCTGCGAEISRKVVTVDILPHTPAEAVKENILPSTCVNEGFYDSVVYCSVCKTEISSDKVPIPITAHTPGSAAVEDFVQSTCKEEGSYKSVVRCTVCTKVISSDTIPMEKTSHNPGPVSIEGTVNSTCTVAGKYYEVTSCTVCKEQISEKEVILELADHIGSTPVKEHEIKATCTSTGSYDEVVYCVNCNTEMTTNKVEVPKLPHTPGTPVKEKITEATCLNIGSYEEVSYCTVCKTEIAGSRTTKVIDKLDHVAGAAKEENRKEPANCSEYGSYDLVVRCTVCKNIISSDAKVIDPPAHKPGPAATETSPQVCTVCNKVLSPAIGHTHKWESGWTINAEGHWHACSGCAEKKDYMTHSYTNSCDADCNVCAALRSVTGHEYDHACDTACNKCGEVRATEHKYDNSCDTQCNICHAERTITHTYDSLCDGVCNVCGFERIPSDHAFGSWKTVTEPTATATGLRERSCMICYTKETEVIPATGSTIDPPATSDNDTTPVTPGTTDDTEPAVPGTTDEQTGSVEPGTSEEPNVTTGTPSDVTTVDPEATIPVVEPDPGCGSVISAGIVIVAILGCGLIIKKKD